MKLEVPRDLTREQARLALTLLEYLIDGLMDFYHEMRRVYGIAYVEEEREWPPF